MTSRVNDVLNVINRSLDCNDELAWQSLSDLVYPIATKVCAGADAETCADFPTWVMGWFYERRRSAIKGGSDSDSLSKLLIILNKEPNDRGQEDGDKAIETTTRFLYATMRDYALPDYYRERNRILRRPDNRVTNKAWFSETTLVSQRLQDRIDRQGLVAHVNSKIAGLSDVQRVAFRIRFFPLLQTLDDSDICFIMSRNDELQEEERFIDVSGDLTKIRDDVYALLKAEAESTGRKDVSFEMVGQLLCCSPNTANTNVLRSRQALRDSLSSLEEWRKG